MAGPYFSTSEFERARAIYEMAHADALGPLSDEEVGLLSDAESAAYKTLLLSPSPDLAAVAYKLEVFAAQDCFGMYDQHRDPLFNALIADVRRLGAVEQPERGATQ